MTTEIGTMTPEEEREWARLDQQRTACARPAPDIRPAAVRMLANNLRNNAYDVAARTMEDLLARVQLLEAAQPAASAEPVMRIYAEGTMRSVTEWLDGARDLTDGDHTLYAAPVAAQAPFIGHETLRRALSHLGIAAPVSNEELGADMAWYTRRVVEAAAQAPAADADARDREDAERYRLLRRKVCIVGGKFHILNLDPRYIAPDAAVELDAAIDAAMRKEG